MARPKRTKFERERDLEIISSMYLQGMYQSEIAKKIGVSQEQISYDIRKIQKRWRETSIGNISELRIKELGKIDEVERVAWAAYKRTEKLHTKTSTKTIVSAKDGERTETGDVKEKLLGDPRFLQVINTCIAKRAEIIGLDSPRKIEDVTKPTQTFTIGGREIEF